MGEIAEMMLEGFLDEETGEMIDGEAPGYPRRMSEMRKHQVTFDQTTEPLLKCPVCARRVRGTTGLADHRMAKGH